MGLIEYDFEFSEPLSENELSIDSIIRKLILKTGISLHYEEKKAKNKNLDGSIFYTSYYAIHTKDLKFVPIDLSFDSRYIGFSRRIASIDYLMLSVFYLCCDMLLSYNGGIVSDLRRNEYSTKKSDNVYDIFKGMKFSSNHYQTSLKKYSELSPTGAGSSKKR